jgi:hypothetical protein
VIEYLGAVMEVGGTPAEDPASLLPRAERWLGGEGSSDQAWRARLFELYAAIGTTDRAVAASYRTAAVQMYDGAGDVQASEEAQSRAPRPDVRPDAGRPRVVVNVTLRQGVVKAQVEKRHRLLPRRRGPAADPLPGMIARWTAGGAAEPYPPELPALMADRWPEFTRFLTELINAADLTVRQRRTVGQPDLAVRVKDGALQSMPWELAARPKADKPLFAEFRRAYRCPAREAPDTRLVRVVQAGLNLLGNYNVQVDGVSGPDTAKALDAYSRAQDAPLWRLDDPEMVQHLHEALLQGARPTVIILRSAAGASHPRDLALERRYAQAGFAVTVVDQVHLPALPTLLRGEPPPVIVHIVGGLVATAGATAVDLNDDASAWGSSDETGLLTSADLDQTLRVVSLDWPAPVVVLDVPVPSGDRETGDQLLLRNWFAGDLFALGGTRAVIGTGLAGRKASDLVRDVLIERLAHGDAIGDVVQAMRQQGPSADFGGFGSGVAFAAIALWGNDPGIRLPARGGS